MTSQASLTIDSTAMASLPGYNAPTYPPKSFSPDAILTVATARELLAYWPTVAATLPEVLRSAFAAAMGGIEKQVAVLVERFGETERLLGIGVYDAHTPLGQDHVTDLKRACPSLGADVPGFEFQIRRHYHSELCSLYVPSLGTLDLTVGDDESYVSFSPCRSCSLNPSYSDNCLVIELGEERWRKQLGRAQDAPKGGFRGVTPVKHGGKSYAVTSAMYSSNASEGNAWELVPAAAWGLDPIPHAQIYAEFDAGTRERGDLRGSGVMVGGALFVLGPYVTFLDQRPTSARSPATLAEIEEPADFGLVPGDEDDGDDAEDPFARTLSLPPMGQVGQRGRSSTEAQEQLSLF